MPHAALWVVQLIATIIGGWARFSFNAARGFVSGAAQIREEFNDFLFVSMPHAALWVVQRGMG